MGKYIGRNNMVWMLHEVEINDQYGNEKYPEIYLYKNREDAIQRIMDETSLTKEKVEEELSDILHNVCSEHFVYRLEQKEIL